MGCIETVFDILDVIVDTYVKAVTLMLERVNMETLMKISSVMVGISLLGSFPHCKRNNI